MPEHMHSSITAVTYAKSLLELATERKVAEETGQELLAIRQVMEGNREFAEYLRDPGISRQEKIATINRIFGGRASDLVLKFLGVLGEHDRLRLLVEIENAYADLYEEQVGNVEVDVTSVSALSAEQVELVRQRVSTALGKNAVVHQYVDESILGGLVLRVQDKMIDASVRYQLKAIHDRLLSHRASDTKQPWI
jgi:F-type H+-transporting ATPase subunit delta